MSRGETAVRLGAAFVLGSACALWLLPVLFGPRVQQLRLERDAERAKAEALAAEVHKLTQALERRQGAPVVKQVQVQVEGPDQRVAVEARRRLQKLLMEGYVGRPIGEISALLLAQRFQGMLLEIDGVRYRLDLELIAIGPELALYGVVSPLKSGANPAY